MGDDPLRPLGATQDDPLRPLGAGELPFDNTAGLNTDASPPLTIHAVLNTSRDEPATPSKEEEEIKDIEMSVVQSIQNLDSDELKTEVIRTKRALIDGIVKYAKARKVHLNNYNEQDTMSNQEKTELMEYQESVGTWSTSPNAVHRDIANTISSVFS